MAYGEMPPESPAQGGMHMARWLQCGIRARKDCEQRKNRWSSNNIDVACCWGVGRCSKVVSLRLEAILESSDDHRHVCLHCQIQLIAWCWRAYQLNSMRKLTPAALRTTSNCSCSSHMRRTLALLWHRKGTTHRCCIVAHDADAPALAGTGPQATGNLQPVLVHHICVQLQPVDALGHLQTMSHQLSPCSSQDSQGVRC